MEIVPKGSLYRSLKRLQNRNLIVKSKLTGRVFYFKTKRRATRKLSQTEMKIFKALPREGISARDLRGKVGVNLRRVYKYLRRLRYKRHVKKEEKAVFYNVTDTGRSLAQSLNVAYNLIYPNQS
jgi:DNA-binding MarR family transcriptional regulator